jgi:hypothetical protein
LLKLFSGVAGFARIVLESMFAAVIDTVAPHA